MPDDSNGNYSLPNGYRAVTGQTIEASQHNPPLEDIAATLTNRISRLGNSVMLGILRMGGFRITGMADGISAQDAATKGQLDQAVGDAVESLTEEIDDQVSVLVPQTRTISTSGLATGGGTLTANRTIGVPAASQAQAQAGSANDVAMTPLRTTQHYRAQSYTGSNANNTNFPINTVLRVPTEGTSLPLRAAVNVYISSTGRSYTLNPESSSGVQLQGTWLKQDEAGGAIGVIRIP